MIGSLRRIGAIGLAVLLMGSLVNPIASASVPESEWAVEQSAPTTPTGSVSTSYPLTSSPFSLTVSPTRLTVAGSGLTQPQKIQVVNRGQAPVSVTAEKRNFLVATDGSLNYQALAPYSASTWVTVRPTAFTVAPGATQVVTIDVVVPAAPEAGDHEVAIVFLVPAGKTSANIKINRGIAAPVFITVPGELTDTSTLHGLTAKGFADGGPVTISAQVQNEGTVHRDFRAATPLLVDAPGRAAPFPDFTVARGSLRQISTTWNPPLLCICHPTVTIQNADGVVSSMSVRVIVFPVRLLVITVFVILLLVLVLWLVRRRFRNHVATAAARLHRPVVSPGV